MSGGDRAHDSEEAQPGLRPGSPGSEGIMLAALYGELASHPWRDPATASEDAYSLFYTRSLAMGWLTDVTTRVQVSTNPLTGYVEEREIGDVGAEGLWSMHEAESEQDHPDSRPASSPVASFQVGIETVPADRPLPVQPFLCCTGDVVARLGTLRLQAVQVLLPLQKLDTSSRLGPLFPPLGTTGWFTDRDRQSKTQIRITVDSGQNPSIPTAAPGMLTEMHRPEQDAFVCDGYSLADHDPLAATSPFHDNSWHGPPLHRATFRGTLAEWSLDAVGWLAAFLAGASAHYGVTTPIMLTASRDA